MRILGVDPSLYMTGYGVVDCEGAVIRLVEGGVITPKRSRDLPKRLAELQRSLREVIAALHPDVMAIEEVFSQTAYPRTAIMMAHARGALVCAAALENIPVFNYSATAVKRALIGNGAATKDQVGSMVAEMLRLSKERIASLVVEALRLRGSPKPDLTDALALAIAHGCRVSSRLGDFPIAHDNSYRVAGRTSDPRLPQRFRRGT